MLSLGSLLGKSVFNADGHFVCAVANAQVAMLAKAPSLVKNRGRSVIHSYE